jgi:hypothetical protein
MYQNLAILANIAIGAILILLTTAVHHDRHE